MVLMGLDFVKSVSIPPMSTSINKESVIGQAKDIVDLSKHAQLSEPERAIIKAVFGDNDPLEVIRAPEGSPLRARTQVQSFVLSTNGKEPITLQYTSPGHRLVMPGNCVITITP